jgi:NitT/TauT family transport system substrate-binding protein
MRLTPFAKLLIVLLLTGVLTSLYLKRNEPPLRDLFAKIGLVPSGQRTAEEPPARDQPSADPSAPGPTGQVPPPTPPSRGGRPRIVVGVNDFGGAYPGLVANDGASAGPRSLFTKAGLDVEIKLVRGSKERLEKFEQGEIDVMLLTLDYVANLVADYKKSKNLELQSFLFVDWSRGNLGIVARPSFESIESLKTARLATTRNTPTHYFTLTLLDRSNLNKNEIESIKSGFVFAKKTPDAGEMFQRGEVDAVAIWEPHLSKAIAEGKGRLLVSTSTATNLIADVLFARKSFLDEKAQVMPAFVRAWLEGVKQLNDDVEGSVSVISKAFSQSPEETRAILSKIKPATFADNRAFFGLETEGSPFASLLSEAGEIWKREGVIDAVPAAKQVARVSFLESLRDEFRSEKVVESFQFEKQKADAPALLSKSLSIYFAPGSADLDPTARKNIDGFAEDVASIFQNAYIRVEGNTDSTGDRKLNLALSTRRAEAVVSYLVSRHRFDPNRFVAKGNGPDRPVGDNATESGREYNRRTDFRVVPNY